MMPFPINEPLLEERLATLEQARSWPPRMIVLLAKKEPTMLLLSNAYRRVFQVLVIGLVMVACGTAQSPTANPNIPAAASTPTAAAPATAGNATLDIYNWGTFIDPQVVSDFEAAYNVKVKLYDL
jgi:hypothetical protein